MILPLLLFLLSPSPDLLVPPAWIAEHGAIPVDVRPAAAFVAGHLPGAVRVAVAPECVAAGVGCVQGALGKAGLAGGEVVVGGGEGGGGGWAAAGKVWETLKELGPRPRTLVDPQAEFVLYGEGPADLQPGLGYLLLRRAGIPVRVFPGGFQEWSRDSVDPVVRIVGAPEVGRLLEAENPGLKGDEVARSVVLLDLREPGDFRLEHIPGADNFPAYAEGVPIEKVVAEKWPRARASRAPVVLYCYGRQCIRSRDAAARLARAGFTSLLWLREGVEAWREAGLPMASAPRSVPRGAPHRAEASRIPIQEDAGFPGPASASLVVYRSLVYHRRRP